ncbi:type VII secretion system (Wss) protein ESAT-6 [Streptomyces sp. 1114.5]|uniref:WXG100 family type VII secretion target n=1 Tax=unclassified Streptomyces TaxID=2593676 RepID=UPI000BD33E38|nr:MULTISPECIES: WXG100 family type VII secretion target [unclassified Streptomyces]RKT19558.1 type VII secretion system (Wss) protein ESAT-6 [Streptomyces sp. 1114.5]SOB85753.1 Proteins of 100 residues with WXG [Streptomyces sp. 1331.2]
MADLEFERRMNPWLFDANGNLTADAKKQFPDLAGANDAPVSLGGGQTVKANPAVLQQAAQNAFALRDSVKTELSQPGEHVNAAAGALKGWSLGTGLTGLWMTWSAQAEGLRSSIEDIGNRLQSTSQSYAKTESDVSAGFQQGAKA